MLTAPILISDPEDRRLELYRGLPDSALRVRVEAEHGLFVVEGARSLRALLASPYPLLSVLLRPERLAGLADVVAAAYDARGAGVCRRSPGLRWHRRVSGAPGGAGASRAPAPA